MRISRARKCTAAFLVAGYLVFTSATASAQTKDELYVASISATCAACHGTLGKVADGSAVVSLAGLPKDYIVAQMAAFKSGARSATVMHQLSKGYSDEQVAMIASYFAAQKK
jgi:cytochrome subunit of sulfide dehydrogenase